MSGTTPSEGMTITLLVDDDASILDLVRLHLRDAGIMADTACGPHDALQKLATGRYRVVVSDVEMPGISGIELAERIRGMDPLVQVIMLTADDSPVRLASSRVAGASDLLSKMHDFGRISAVVAEALERSRRWARLESTEPAATRHASVEASASEDESGQAPASFVGASVKHARRKERRRR